MRLEVALNADVSGFEFQRRHPSELHRQHERRVVLSPALEFEVAHRRANVGVPTSRETCSIAAPCKIASVTLVARSPCAAGTFAPSARAPAFAPPRAHRRSRPRESPPRSSSPAIAYARSTMNRMPHRLRRCPLPASALRGRTRRRPDVERDLAASLEQRSRARKGQRSAPRGDHRTAR